MLARLVIVGQIGDEISSSTFISTEERAPEAQTFAPVSAAAHYCYVMSRTKTLATLAVAAR
jgi:hypothetical protein